MDYLFFQRALLSFVAGAGFVLLVTIAAERLGSKIGGLVSGLPGSTMIALLFIGIHNGPEFSAQAAAVSPAILGVVIIFFTVYSSIEKLTFWPRLCTSLPCWFALSYLVVISGFNELFQTIPILILALIGCYLFLEFAKDIPSSPSISIAYTKSQLAFRAICAGVAVVAALVISKFSGPVWGGVASTFPVATVASLVILQKTAGLDFTRAMLKTAIISAAVNVGTYVVLVSLTYPSFGVGTGTLLSAAGSILTAYGSLIFIRRYVK